VCVEEADIWMLDGDDAISQTQDSLNRVSRPNHLDFLRITPPEDDIIGDTPYYPQLECTVRAAAPTHLANSNRSYLGLCDLTRKELAKV
jgi:hypothetical protein